MSPMSEISSTISPISTTAQRRKIKKPLIEKRRRLRINQCLSNLKSLVLEATNKDENCFPKMEKADILEMTVAYMKTMKHRAPASGSGSPDSTEHARTYLCGFRECAMQVCSFLVDNSSVAVGEAELRGQLTRHLTACFQRIQVDLQRQVDQSGIFSTSPTSGQDPFHANKMSDITDRQSSSSSPCHKSSSSPIPVPLPVQIPAPPPQELTKNLGSGSPSSMTFPPSLPSVSCISQLSKDPTALTHHRQSNPSSVLLPNSSLLPQVQRSPLSRSSPASVDIIPQQKHRLSHPLSQPSATFSRCHSDRLSPKKADEFPVATPSLSSPSMMSMAYGRSSASLHDALPVGHAQSSNVWRPW